jgi:hypothetical protein
LASENRAGMNRSNFYFGQPVTEGELDQAFNDVDEAFAAFLRAFSYQGITRGAEVAENAPANFTVVVTPGTVYDQTQRHIEWFTNQVVNCALDEVGAATAVSTPGQEKWLSIFAQYQETLSDPRTDENNATVYYRRTEGFKLNVVQGAQAPSATRPPLRGDQILVADILIIHGQTQLVDADIDFTRSQVAFVLTGSPLAIREKNLADVLQAMLDTINTFEADIAAIGSDTLTVDAIAGSPHAVTSNTVQNVFGQLLGFVNTVAAAAGVSVAAISDSPLSIVAGTVQNVFGQVLAFINDTCAHLNRTNTFANRQLIDVSDDNEALKVDNSHISGLGIRTTCVNGALLAKSTADASIAATIEGEGTGSKAIRAIGDEGVQIEGVNKGLRVSTSVGGGEAVVEVIPHSGGCAALHLHTQTDPPTLQNGDIWVSASGTVLKVRLGGVTRTINVT